MYAIVHVERLRKIYGETIAVNDISFDVHEGEIFGMVGPNGAGKTTTIECLEGLRKPDEGIIRVLGVDPQVESQILRRLAPRNILYIFVPPVVRTSIEK